MSQKEGWCATPRVSRRAGGTAFSDLAFPDEVRELVHQPGIRDRPGDPSPFRVAHLASVVGVKLATGGLLVARARGRAA